MTFGELRRYAAEIRGLGFPASRLRTALALRTALPFASLVMALLAVPFGFRMGRKGTLVGLGPGRGPGHGLLGRVRALPRPGRRGRPEAVPGRVGSEPALRAGGIAGSLRMRT